MFFWSYRRGAADLKACARRYQPFVGTPPRRFSLRRGGCLAEPNQSLVSDIRYSRTREGWLYLAVEVDLFSRPLVGWSMGSRIDTDLVLDALLMALWRRQPKQAITVHSDQGCQFTGQEWQKALRDHNRVSSMSRRGNCHDNAGDTSPVEFERRIPKGSGCLGTPGRFTCDSLPRSMSRNDLSQDVMAGSQNPAERS